MTLEGLALVLCGAGALMTGFLTLIFLRDPIAGLARTGHRAEQLPQVMTDRYFAMTMLAVGATIFGDLKVIAVLFASFAVMGFADAWIYKRAGFPVAKHVGAGVAALLVTTMALIALGQGS